MSIQLTHGDANAYWLLHSRQTSRALLMATENPVAANKSTATGSHAHDAYSYDALRQ